MFTGGSVVHRYIGKSTMCVFKAAKLHIPDKFHDNMHLFVHLHHVMSAPNTVDQSTSLLQQPMATSANTSSGGGRKARVPSCYIRQMSEANLLISAEQIQLMDSVGQGQVVATQV